MRPIHLRSWALLAGAALVGCSSSGPAAGVPPGTMEPREQQLSPPRMPDAAAPEDGPAAGRSVDAAGLSPGAAMDTAVSVLPDGGGPNRVALPALDALADVPAGQLLFQDRFSAGSRAGWTEVLGTWSLCPFQDRLAYCQADPGLALSFVGDATWADYEVEATVAVDGFASPGWVILPFRASGNPNTFWSLRAGIPIGTGTREWEIWVPVPANSDTRNGHTAGGAVYYERRVPFTVRLRVEGRTATVTVPTGAARTQSFRVERSYPLAGRVGIGSKGQAITVLSFRVTKI